MLGWQPSLFDLRGQIHGVWEISIGEEAGKTIQNIRLKIQRFPDLARRAPSTITDDIGSHGCTVLAVALINLLNDLLSSIAAGQIDINIRPAFAPFTQETLEKKFATDRIN